MSVDLNTCSSPSPVCRWSCSDGGCGSSASSTCEGEYISFRWGWMRPLCGVAAAAATSPFIFIKQPKLRQRKSRVWIFLRRDSSFTCEECSERRGRRRWPSLLMSLWIPDSLEHDILKTCSRVKGRRTSRCSSGSIFKPPVCDFLVSGASRGVEVSDSPFSSL